jgi:hypothetical protein
LHNLVFFSGVACRIRANRHDGAKADAPQRRSGNPPKKHGQTINDKTHL